MVLKEILSELYGLFRMVPLFFLSMVFLLLAILSAVALDWTLVLASLAFAIVLFVGHMVVNKSL